MSKMDNLRAMREAKYAAAQRAAGAAKPTTRATPSKPVAKAAPTASKTAKAAPSATPSAGAEELCGHRNMSGRTCTREKGHAAKSHRYS